MVKGEHASDEIEFYGVINDIIELLYPYGRRIFLFKSDWWDVGDRRNGIKNDGFLISVNVSQRWYKDEPYIFVDQALQVFYLDDIKNGEKWKIVQKTSPQNIYDVSQRELKMEKLYS